MTEQLIEIGSRLKGLRNVMDYTIEKMAGNLKLDAQEYLAYERGERDFSFSFLFNAANILGVDIVDIISGETPKLTTCAIVRKGDGYDIKRGDAYDYKHLAHTFSKKKAEPFMVTVEPNESCNESLHTHEGQEFNYIVSGNMEFHIDDASYVLGEGDSVYFDSNIPHVLKPIGKETAKFIAVVIK